jgi:hypothetical protein
VAQAIAIDAFTNSGTNTFSLSDTAAHLAAAPAGVANQATNITVSDVATVAQASAIDAFLNAGVNSYTLGDTAANLLAPAASAVVNAAALVSVTNAVSVAEAAACWRATSTVYSLPIPRLTRPLPPAVGNGAKHHRDHRSGGGGADRSLYQ